MDNSAKTQRCAALYRVSTTRQVTRNVDTDETLPVQRESIREFVRLHPLWTLTAEYSEEGVSAYRHASADRDVLQDVLRAAARREFDILLVFKADRLSRQALEYPVILAQLRQAGVTVISVADATGGKVLEVEGQFEKLIRFIEGWQAETESYNTSIRVSAAMEQMARKGRWTGGTPPYGYRFSSSPNEIMPIEIDPDEAAVVRRIFDWYLDDGVGTVTIAIRLNADEIPARRGGLWSDLAIRRMMKNPILSGHMAYGRKRQNASGNRAMRGREHWHEHILGPFDASLAIIDLGRWQMALDKMGAYSSSLPRQPHYTRADQGTLLFTGFAKCAACGGAMVAHHGYYWAHRKDGDYKIPRVQYGCLAKVTKGAKACSGQRTFSQKKVENAVLPAILRTLRHLDQDAIIVEARRIAEQSLFHRHARAGQMAKKLGDAQRIHDGWLQRLDTFLAHPDQSLYSESILATKVRDSELNLAELIAQQAELDQDEATMAAQVADLERFLATTQDWWQHFLDAPRPRQKALLSHVLDRVIIGREGYDIYYRLDLAHLTGTQSLPPLVWHTAEVWA